jgi:DNA repair protein RecN (Recombination protein N)
MLTELHIENFAIIQRLDLSFSSHMVAFTGETGAGKSIILDAIEALVGGKADVGLIRVGSDRAIVEATFSIPDQNRERIQAVLEREDLLDDEKYLILSREIRREGRSTARVNGRAVSASLLRELGSYLIDIHGQSEHLSLLNVRQHIGLLDRYANSEKLLSEYQKTYQELSGVRRELAALRQTEKEASQRLELYNFQLQEIDTAQLKPGEEDELRRERDRLANAENLSSLSQQSLLVLEEGEPESPSVSDLIGRLVQSMATLSRIDPSMAEIAQQAEAVAETLAEMARDLRDYLDQVEFNPRRLEQIEDRLELIHNLKRKYGGSIEAVLAYGEDVHQKLETITHAGERIEVLVANEKILLQKIAQHGQKLSAYRQKAAGVLSQGVERELADLKMPGARFKVDVHCSPDPRGVPAADGQMVSFDETGLDQVEFLIAPNPGEGFKPMVKIASGGETARLMLALKNVLAQADSIPTLIFDEIDQGIGGRVGMVVGEKLWQLSRSHQTLCVTHLPQLAVFGDQHLHVRKLVHEGRTATQVIQLQDEARVDELALMIGALTEANRKAAQETLQMAQHRIVELKK